ncbi:MULTISPECIES: hypothetical protein [Rhizobium]|uniref:Uncharacterized protein n=1 Tax=Rhizobium tropici TaxID=398 RepID=A0A6P1C1L7_RHITR|nr:MULTISPECIES: hypothetical protein [Rhizobium]MBB4241280.1 hypothetical protein [Rhizobium tropici]MBB5592174.1 hypothetical protein [Rhizobium tropici]MBB6491605.1 hypothetical protein [Rhizobium tropici]NEV10351.1 hypothetical protein [Rhizobium tropici]
MPSKRNAKPLPGQPKAASLAATRPIHFDGRSIVSAAKHGMNVDKLRKRNAIATPNLMTGHGRQRAMMGNSSPLRAASDQFRTLNFLVESQFDCRRCLATNCRDTFMEAHAHALNKVPRQDIDEMTK